MNDYIKIAKEANAREYLDNLTNRALVVYSPTSMKLVGSASSKAIFASTHFMGKDSAKIDELCDMWRPKEVVGFGGGTAIDIAKYISKKKGCKFICIPAMLTTNTFATDKSALVKDGHKISIDARMPDEIILDFSLIAKAGAKNLYGLCDVLSIHTALCDWRLADKSGKEKIDRKIYKKAQDLLGRGFELVMNSDTESTLDLNALFHLIGESGRITNLYGSGRPESGSEHIFAKELESLVDIPHGISIAIGIKIMSRLQKNESSQMDDVLLRLGIMSDIPNKDELLGKVKQTLAGLHPRTDRYTILDERLPSAGEIDYLTSALYPKAKGF
ncbi:MAG TPA: iron-containing alcohol dehydrogenase [Candidatus Saccharimonadales bacterium]|nr:iron-containing alcohol dehydrogenase [Candidatus Saccharimonadales bacterium]